MFIIVIKSEGFEIILYVTVLTVIYIVDISSPELIITFGINVEYPKPEGFVKIGNFAEPICIVSLLSPVMYTSVQ